MGGARSLLLLAPDDKLAIALQTNTQWGSYIEATGQVLLEAWRRQSGTAKETTNKKAPKRLTYSGTFERRGKDPVAVSGTVIFKRQRGQMEVAAPIADWLRRENVDHFLVRRLGDDLWAIVTPLGIAALRIEEGHGRADLGRGTILEIELDAR